VPRVGFVAHRDIHANQGWCRAVSGDPPSRGKSRNKIGQLRIACRLFAPIGEGAEFAQFGGANMKPAKPPATQASQPGVNVSKLESKLNAPVSDVSQSAAELWNELGFFE
jgi:hypothetical protein